MKKRKLPVILGIIVIIFMIIGVSYAYYIKTFSQVNSNVVKTKCLNLSITNEKNDIKLEEQYPILDSEGKKLVPYQFTITNTCEQFISYNVNLEALEGTTMDSNAIKVMVNSEAPVNLATLDIAQTSIDNSVEARTLATGSLGSGDSVDYALRLWMDYGDSADLSSMNKIFVSKIVVTATVGTYKPSDYVSTLHDAILVNEYGVTDVDNAIKRIESKETPDFTQTAPIIEWQETISKDNMIKTIIKPSIESLNSDEQTSKLEEKDTLLRLYRSKSFEINTGTYILSDPIYVDPTTIDYNGTINYYYANEYIFYNQQSGVLLNESGNQGKIIYKITGSSKSNIKNSWNNVEYDSISYSLNVNTLSSLELESDNSDKGLYVTDDDYGKSYYYRGNVLNNNLYFAGMYWQIIRINGDNSIRVLFNGLDKNSNGLNQMIDNKLYQFNSLYDNPAYVGYMYGNYLGTSYSDVHNNTNSSNVKNIVDNWYYINIVSKGYGKYIFNNSYFCGDRSINNDSDGIQLDKNTNFGSYNRSLNNTISFKCQNYLNDIYTVVDSGIGNRALTYPVGLITYDELVASGMNFKISNNLSYTYSSKNYWTMSPSYFDSVHGIAGEWYLNSDGYLAPWNYVANYWGIRPVINLKADVKISGGIGTINDPYIIKTE